MEPPGSLQGWHRAHRAGKTGLLWISTMRRSWKHQDKQTTVPCLQSPFTFSSIGLGWGWLGRGGQVPWWRNPCNMRYKGNKVHPNPEFSLTATEHLPLGAPARSVLGLGRLTLSETRTTVGHRQSSAEGAKSQSRRGSGAGGWQSSVGVGKSLQWNQGSDRVRGGTLLSWGAASSLQRLLGWVAFSPGL